MVHKTTKWIRTDAWRGYEQPINAVMGASDTGGWEDSPAPSDKVNSEIDQFRSGLSVAGVKSKVVTTSSSNAFMVKRWVVVDKRVLKKAKEMAKTYLKGNPSLSYIHEVD